MVHHHTARELIDFILLRLFDWFNHLHTFACPDNIGPPHTFSFIFFCIVLLFILLFRYIFLVSSSLCCFSFRFFSPLIVLTCPHLTLHFTPQFSPHSFSFAHYLCRFLLLVQNT
eukprot:m.109803 g.109803  ORF g.109803 m.109803 type:complete len:114 (+) comp9210_c2_seq1:219-560(+)